MTFAKISYASKGNLYIVNGDGVDDRSQRLVSTSRKSLRHALQGHGFNVMSFQGPEGFSRFTRCAWSLKERWR